MLMFTQRLSHKISKLLLRGNMDCLQKTFKQLILSVMAINIEVFGAFMEDWIFLRYVEQLGCHNAIEPEDGEVNEGYEEGE